MNKIHISKETLIELYWNQSKKPREIATLFGIKNERTIRKKMEKYEIKRRTLSEAMTTKMKKPFTGDLFEKSYLLGLRTGDFHARWMKQSIRIQTSTTHPALVKLLKEAFINYGETCTYLSKARARQYEWFIYVDLHPSFEFLIKKPVHIPDWILKDESRFFQFLAAYVDCEGNWHFTKSHEKHSRFTFRLRTGDKDVLEDIKRKLEDLSYRPILSLIKPRGTRNGSVYFKKNIYGLILNRKQDVHRLARKLLSLTKHYEKTIKINLMLSHSRKPYRECLLEWEKIRSKIKMEVLPLNK